MQLVKLNLEHCSDGLAGIFSFHTIHDGRSSMISAPSVWNLLCQLHRFWKRNQKYTIFISFLNRYSSIFMFHSLRFPNRSSKYVDGVAGHDAHGRGDQRCFSCYSSLPIHLHLGVGHRDLAGKWCRHCNASMHSKTKSL